jgi:hypothetical protein
MALIIAEPEWIDARCKHAHYEIEISGKELEEFEAMTDEEQIEYVLEEGTIWVDDVSVYDRGKIKKCVIHK